jgi:hypothetical protein
MDDDHDEYTDAEWEAAAGHRPIRDLDVNVRLLLHRQWYWAHVQRDRFRTTLPNAPSPADTEAWLMSEAFCSLFLWYAILYSVIEEFADRSIDLREPMAADIDAVREPLRLTRNAVFHVSKKYWDDRLFALMGDPNNVARIYRIHGGFGRLFLQDRPHETG